MVYLVIWLHCFADFFLQTDAMAKNKSKSSKWLCTHVLVYTIPFLVLLGWKYALVNGVAHFCVDFITSRMTSRLWELKETHWFFAVIGVDQAIHLTVLVCSLPLATLVIL